MKENFISMPIILKFITGHAIACFMLFIGSVIPHDSFNINGQSVTYYEWWASGAGIGASSIGLLFSFAAWHILNKSKYSRHIYILTVTYTHLTLPTFLRMYIF